MKTITRENLQDLIAKVNAALAQVGAAEGVVMRVGNGTFSGANAKLTVTVATIDGETVRTPEHDALLQLGELYGLKGVTPGQQVQLNGEQFAIVGLNRKSRKAPVMLKRVQDGRGYKASAEAVRAAIASTAAR